MAVNRIEHLRKEKEALLNEWERIWETMGQVIQRFSAELNAVNERIDRIDAELEGVSFEEYRRRKEAKLKEIEREAREAIRLGEV